MQQPIPFHTVQELEQYLQTQYGAAAIEPVDYLLYNARQQLLNLFYPEVVGQLAALCGYTPDASEEVTALLDELLAQYDSQTLQSDYAQYRFVRTAPQGRGRSFMSPSSATPALCCRSTSGRRSRPSSRRRTRPI